MKRKKERLKHRCGREKKQGEGRKEGEGEGGMWGGRSKKEGKEGERKRQRQRKRRPNLQKVLRQLCVLRAWIGEFCNLELDSLGNFSTFSFFFFFANRDLSREENINISQRCLVITLGRILRKPRTADCLPARATHPRLTSKLWSSALHSMLSRNG